MDERSSDTDETFGSQGPPSDVSNQNAEESEAPSGGDGQGQASRHESNPQTEGGREGGGGEESQATGNPSNAG